MTNPKLQVKTRDLLGKKVKKLRKDGLLPANIYGKDIKSTAVSLALADFQTVFKEVGETGLVDLQLEGQVRPVLIKNLQIDHETNTPLHADFFQVNLKEKVKTMVPLLITGEAKAVTDKLGMLLQPLTEVEVEALPADLPENIEINIEALAQIDDQILVKDLKTPSGVTVLTEPEQVVVKIAELVSKETQEEAKAEAEAAAQAKEEGQEAAATEQAEEKTETEAQTPAKEEKK